MDIEQLDRDSMDYSEMEIIHEQEIPLDCDPEEINSNLVVAAKFLNGIQSVEQKRQTLKQQKDTVMAWFSDQMDKLDRQDEFLKSKIDQALYTARQNGEAKPKIKTWAGSAYYSKRTKLDWNGLSNTSNELVRLAKKHNLTVEVIEKISLADLKKVLTEEDKKSVGITETTTETLTIRKS